MNLCIRQLFEEVQNLGNGVQEKCLNLLLMNSIYDLLFIPYPIIYNLRELPLKKSRYSSSEIMNLLSKPSPTEITFHEKPCCTYDTYGEEDGSIKVLIVFML